MNKIATSIIDKYKSNPGWYWLMATIFLFPILPEYISPFILFIGFIVFKRQWTRENKQAKIGTLGKIEIAFMSLALVSVLWSDSKLDTLGCAGLWWGMFLCQVMINNLANTKEKIRKILELIVSSAAINGFIGAIQICTYTLFDAGYISKAFVLVNPFYKTLDKAVYSALPFSIITKTFDDRASAFFSNPNLLASFLIVAFPIAIYLFLNSKSKKEKGMYFLCNVLISAGMASTLTRAACIITVFGWIFMFFVLIKRHYKEMLLLLLPVAGFNIPSVLARYGFFELPRLHKEIETISSVATVITETSSGVAAIKSSQVHFAIWQNVFDYLITHWDAFILGLGFGSESTGNMLRTYYDLNKPHSHNFIFEIWIELGIIGLVLLAFIIVKAVITLFSVHSKNGENFDLIFSIVTSLALFLLFGLTDYIFNSPKQIILLMILFGITQAISKCYDTTKINNANDLIEVTTRGIKDIANMHK